MSGSGRGDPQKSVNMRCRRGAGRSLEVAPGGQPGCQVPSHSPFLMECGDVTINWACTAISLAALSWNEGNGKRRACVSHSDSHPSKGILIFSCHRALRGDTVPSEMP